MSGIVAGKLALVTGAGSGIGRAVCLKLAKEGAKVIACDKNLKTVEDTVGLLEGKNHFGLSMDVASLDSVKSVFEIIKNDDKKSATIIVNSAGITRDNYLLKLSEDDFDDVINVNLKGTFLVMQNAVKAMIEAGESQGSSIVNLGSIVAKLGNIGQSNYTASKAGVEALTRTASMEFGKFGVRVNAVIPGFVKSPMTDVIPENIKRDFLNRSPSGRMGNPEEVAEVIAFLTSDKSSFVNGASIEVTGGFH